MTYIIHRLRQVQPSATSILRRVDVRFAFLILHQVSIPFPSLNLYNSSYLLITATPSFPTSLFASLEKLPPPAKSVLVYQVNSFLLHLILFMQFMSLFLTSSYSGTFSLHLFKHHY